MTLPPHNIRAPTDADNPQYVGVCDRCGFFYPLDQLVWQYDYRGRALANLRIRVCTEKCLDQPYEHYRQIQIGPDSIPPRDPRPTSYATQNLGGQPPIYNPNTLVPNFSTGATYIVTETGIRLVTEGGVEIIE